MEGEDEIYRIVDISGATASSYKVKKESDDEPEMIVCKIYVDGEYFTGYDFYLHGEADHEHNWLRNPRDDWNPTCDGWGAKNYFCTICDQDKYEFVPEKGHTFTYTVEKKPTISEEGLKSGVCSECGFEDEESIPKLQPTIKVNVTYIPLKVKQATNAIRVSYAAGDGIASWTSSNLAIASVDANGKITGRKAGTAVITVTLKSGLKQNITVKVQKKAVATKSINVATKSVVLKKGQKISLGATVNPITSKQKLKYKSSKKKVATVSKGGIVTAKKAGKATITVTSGKKKVKVKVTVK